MALIYAESAAETPGGMVLQGTGDQHGVQAKGAAQTLCEITASS
jgi:hypothetical protein